MQNGRPPLLPRLLVITAALLSLPCAAPIPLVVQLQSKAVTIDDLRSRFETLRDGALKRCPPGPVLRQREKPFTHPTDILVVEVHDDAEQCLQRALAASRSAKRVFEDRMIQGTAESPGELSPTARKLLVSPQNVVKALDVEPALWARGAKGQGVKVAVFDTGIVTSHESFRKAKVKLCINYTDGKTCEDGFGHGTFVAGLIASQQGCVGMAPEAELYIFKVFTDKQLSYTSWFLDAFNHAIAEEVDVLNLSIGGPDYLDQPFVEKVWEASANGITVISAIGNDGPLYGTLNNPADQIDVLGVGAVTQANTIATFSSRGMTTWELPYGYGRIKPDVVTYGEMVRSTSRRGGCTTLSGTSVASPVVAGAVTGLMSLAKLRGKAVNPAVVKQVLTDTAARVRNSPVYEQGMGAINLTAAAAYLVEYTPHISFLPRRLELDTMYFWPFSRSPLYYTRMPLVVNVTVLNPLALHAYFDGRPTWRAKNNAHANILEVSTERPMVLWPWAGWMAVSLSVTPEGASFEGLVEGEVQAAFKVNGERHTASLQIRVKVIKTPPRNRRLLWDVYHNLQYPPSYVTRDDLRVTTDMLDWNGDHPHTNYKDTFDFLVRKGYHVELLTDDFTTFNASHYLALLMIDTEEAFLPQEKDKLKKDVAGGLGVVVFADWYNPEVMSKVGFKDDNTRTWWDPIVGGANIPALNYLLEPHGIALGTKVLEGNVKPTTRIMFHPYMFASGAPIIRFPAGGLLLRSATLVNAGERLIRRPAAKENAAILGMTNPKVARVAVFGDSNCLDGAHQSRTAAYCFDLLHSMLQYVAKGEFPQDYHDAPGATVLSTPYATSEQPLLTAPSTSFVKASHVLANGGDRFRRGAPHRAPLPSPKPGVGDLGEVKEKAEKAMQSKEEGLEKKVRATEGTVHEAVPTVQPLPTPLPERSSPPPVHSNDAAGSELARHRTLVLSGTRNLTVLVFCAVVFIMWRRCRRRKRRPLRPV